MAKQCDSYYGVTPNYKKHSSSNSQQPIVTNSDLRSNLSDPSCAAPIVSAAAAAATTPSSLSRSSSLRNSLLFRSSSLKRQVGSSSAPSTKHKRALSNASLVDSINTNHSSSKRDSILSISSPILVPDNQQKDPLDFALPARRAPVVPFNTTTSQPKSPLPNHSSNSCSSRHLAAAKSNNLKHPTVTQKRGDQTTMNNQQPLTRFNSTSRMSIESSSTGISVASSEGSSKVFSGLSMGTPASSRQPSQTNVNQTCQLVSQMSISNLPPMDDIWLDDEEDEDDDDDGNKMNIIKKWHGRKESRSTLHSNTNSLSSGTSMTTSGANSSNSYQKGPNPSMSFTNLKRLAGRKKSPSEMPSPVRDSAPQTDRNMSAPSDHSHFSSISSSASTAKNNRFKKFFNGSNGSSSQSVTKDMISNPSNFVHTGHLDPFTLKGMKAEAPPRSNARISGASQASTTISRKDSHWRENSTSSTWSMNSYGQQQGDNNAFGTPATSAGSSPNIPSESQFPINGTKPLNINHSMNRSTATVVMATPNQRIITNKSSRDSFASWSATPNLEFVEQQKWLLHHATESESMTNISAAEQSHAAGLKMKDATASNSMVSLQSFQSATIPQPRHQQLKEPSDRKTSMLLPSPVISQQYDGSQSLDHKMTRGQRQGYVCMEKNQNWGPASALGIMTENDGKWTQLHSSVVCNE